ncbi:MAG: septal ring lytic transglycosylase RlpA family protein [Alphaproteobacteria bacterium]|nr:septal ring lytic transglycosylase RlpA family protein [Alphaproteobacteria bacterium]
MMGQLMHQDVRGRPHRGGIPVVAMAFLVGALALSGCAETQFLIHAAKQVKEQPPSSVGRYKVGDPYQIKGVWYYPKVDWSYAETGIASWYGPGFHGKRTANGEVFDENMVSAAHRTLPLPSVVRVTNLDNGRSLVVRVNDRGPFAHGRIIDMSRRGAHLLDFQRRGTAKVRVEVLETETRQLQAVARGEIPSRTVAAAPPPNGAPTVKVQVAAIGAPSGALQQAARPSSTAVSTLPTSDQPGGATALVAAASTEETIVTGPVEATEIFVQAGAFQSRENAQRLSNRLTAIGPTDVQLAEVAGKTFYRVRIGPVANVAEADRVLNQAIVAGYPGSRIVVD